MKKIYKVLIALGLLFPYMTFAVTATWQTPTTTAGYIVPNLINGSNQTIELPTIIGSTQCLQVNSSGIVSGAGVGCGSGGGSASAALPYGGIQYSILSGTSTILAASSSLTFSTTTGQVTIPFLFASSSTATSTFNGTVNFASTTFGGSTFFTQGINLPGSWIQSGVGVDPGFYFRSAGTVTNFGSNIGIGLGSNFNMIVALSSANLEMQDQNGDDELKVGSSSNQATVAIGTSSYNGALNVQGTTTSSSAVISPCFATSKNGACIVNTAPLINTSQFWADPNRNDSYTPTGSIEYPYGNQSGGVNALASLITGVTNSKVAEATAYLNASTSYIEGNDTLSNIPMNVYADKSTIVTGFGTATGTITIPNNVSWSGGTILGSVNETDTSTSTPHSFENDFAILGNFTGSGLFTFLNGAQLPFSNGATSTLTLNNGSLANLLGNNLISSIIDNGGTLNLNDDQNICTSSQACVIATTTGGSVEVLGLTDINYGGGPCFNLANTASNPIPDSINNITCTVTSPAVNPIVIATGTAVVLNAVTEYSLNGTHVHPTYATYEPSDYGNINVLSTTTTVTLAVTGNATSTYLGGIISPCFATSTAGPCIVPGGSSGGGGTPAGATNSLQYNASGSFGGSGITYNPATGYTGFGSSTPGSMVSIMSSSTQPSTSVIFSIATSSASGTATTTLLTFNALSGLLIPAGNIQGLQIVGSSFRATGLGTAAVPVYTNNTNPNTGGYFCTSTTYCISAGAATSTIFTTGGVNIGTSSLSLLSRLYVQGASGTTTDTFDVASSTGSTTLQITSTGHIVSGGPQPTVSGGTSAMDSPSNDNAGEIAVAGTALTSITMTFATPWVIAPSCTVSDSSTLFNTDPTSITTTQVVFGFTASVTSANVWYICQGTK